MATDLMRLLADKSDQRILGLLSMGPASARKLGRLLSISEAETMRRLGHMVTAGLVGTEPSDSTPRPVQSDSTTQHVQYRLSVRGTLVHFTPAGLEVWLEPFDGSARSASLLPSHDTRPPRADRYVGRDLLLERIDRLHGVVLVVGPPGIGKTAFAARWAALQERPVFWHTFLGTESLPWLADRLALHHARHGDRRWLDALGDGGDDADLHGLVVGMLERKGSAHVLDDLQHIEDEALRAAIEAAIPTATHGTLLLTSDDEIRHDPALDHIRLIRLEGFDEAELQQAFQARGMAVPPHLLPRIRDTLGGRAFPTNLLIEAVDRLGVGLDELLDRLPGTDTQDALLELVHHNLTSAERHVLTLASIFRGPFTLEDLRSLTPKAPDPTLTDLHRRLLVTAIGDGYTLHGLLRGFLYGRLGEHKGLHMMAAARCLKTDTLEGRLEAMHHFLMAGKRDPALELLEEDLDRWNCDFLPKAQQRPYAEIVAAFTREDVQEAYRWAILDEARGDLAHHRHDDRNAISHYETAEKTYRDHDAHLRIASVALKKAIVLERLGRTTEAKNAIEGGLDHSADLPVVQARLTGLQARLAG